MTLETALHISQLSVQQLLDEIKQQKLSSVQVMRYYCTMAVYSQEQYNPITEFLFVRTVGKVVDNQGKRFKTSC